MSLAVVPQPLLESIAKYLPERLRGVLARGRLRLEIRRIANSGKPIVVGPWLSEVGFELLYWIPFLSWVTKRYGISPQRTVVISRGGAESWYTHLCGTYVDAFDFFSPQEFRVRNGRRWSENGGGQKHTGLGDFDRELLQLTMRRLGTDKVEVLHPALMYRLFAYYWPDKDVTRRLGRHTLYEPLPRVDTNGAIAELPSDYVAVRFYFRPSFPDTAENRSFVSELLANLAERTEIVLLNTTLDIDDHRDCEPRVQRRIHSVAHLMNARNNLEVQSAIICRARAFVSTYGGLSYVAPFYGVPAVTFYSHREHFLPVHLDVARRVFQTLGTSYEALHVSEASRLREWVGELHHASASQAIEVIGGRVSN